MTVDPFDALRKLADNIASDIQGDFPNVDTAYDLYVEEIGGATLGVICMGEYYHECFFWLDDAWEQDFSRDSYDVEDMILRERGVRV